MIAKLQVCWTGCSSPSLLHLSVDGRKFANASIIRATAAACSSEPSHTESKAVKTLSLPLAMSPLNALRACVTKRALALPCRRMLFCSKTRETVD